MHSLTHNLCHIRNNRSRDHTMRRVIIYPCFQDICVFRTAFHSPNERDEHSRINSRRTVIILQQFRWYERFVGRCPHRSGQVLEFNVALHNTAEFSMRLIHVLLVCDYCYDHFTAQNSTAKRPTNRPQHLQHDKNTGRCRPNATPAVTTLTHDRGAPLVRHCNTPATHAHSVKIK